MENKTMANYVCKICDKIFNSGRALSYHITHTHKLLTKEYYDKYLRENDSECVCACCAKPTKFINIVEGYQKYCCAKCGGIGSATKGKQTMLQRYGVKGICNPQATSERYNQYTDEQKQAIIAKRQTTRALNSGSVEQSYRDQSIKSINKKRAAIAAFEAENNCTLLHSLVYTYGQGWYKSKIITEFLYDTKGNHYIKNCDIKKIEDYIEQTKSNQSSHKEQEVLDYIKSIYSGKIEPRKKGVLPNNFEIDIYLPDKKMGIEFNGTYWHSTINNTPKNYHFDKSCAAAAVGIRLIHIYEYEWDDLDTRSKICQLLNIALNKANKIYARKCDIKLISNQEAKILNEKVHLQGHRNAQITYGLFYKDTLVQLMSFSRTKYNRNLQDENSWEIIRGCPGSNNVVIGGVSKLISHFIKEHNPAKIFSYCDFNKFDGKSYEAIGMQFIGYTGPDMKWVLPGNIVVNRQPRKHSELQQISRGKIYGSGSKKYILTLR